MVGNRQGEPFEQVLYQGCLLPMDLIEDDFLQVILHREIGVVVVLFDQVRHRRQDRHEEQVAPLVSVDGPTTSFGKQNERIRLAELLVAELVEHGQQEEDLVDIYDDKDVAGYHHRDGSTPSPCTDCSGHAATAERVENLAGQQGLAPQCSHDAR
jgi:hypothetical protein